MPQTIYTGNECSLIRDSNSGKLLWLLKSVENSNHAIIFSVLEAKRKACFGERMCLTK
jgi:hypothetical protein